MQKKFKNLKNNEQGFSGVDLVVAMAVIVIFVPLISTLFVNIYMNWMTTKRNAQANAYATQIIETVEGMYYDEVTQEALDKVVTDLNIPSGYQVEATITNYNEEDASKEDLVKTVTISISYNVDKQLENVTMQTVKSKEILITPNTPQLSQGMVPVKYISTGLDSGYWQITSENDSQWYSYENKRWANVMLLDSLEVENIDDTTAVPVENLVGRKVITPGSMFVWIPRYAYRITYYGDEEGLKNKDESKITGYSNKNGIVNADGTTVNSDAKTVYADIDIKFLYSNTNNYIDSDKMYDIAQTDYIIHPAFQDGTNNNFQNGEWDKEITGIWVSKYEAGYAGGNNYIPVQETSYTYTGNYNGVQNFYGNITAGSTTMKFPVFTPETLAYNNISVGDMYTLAKNLNEENNPYGITTSTDSHLLKNSEWGAVSYLAHSKYGRDTEKISYNNICIDSTISYAVTGYAGENTDSMVNRVSLEKLKTGDTGSYVWKTNRGMLASTTGNVYGIFDLSGASWEMVSAYIQDGDISYGNALDETSQSSKYVTIYGLNETKIGDATRETSRIQGQSYVLGTTGQAFVCRGGSIDSLQGESGIFCISSQNGAASYKNSFRVTLIVR